MHAAIVLLVLILTYAGMAAGRIAWLRVDHTGIALLAVIAGLTFTEYARAGVPITILSIGFAEFWLALTRTLPMLPAG